MKYYYLLGLKSDCTQEEIKKSYRKLSIKFHPDKNDGDDFFKERFQDIQEAYEVLSDERKRKAYDESFKFSNQNKKQEPYRELRDPIIEFFKSDKSEIYDQETILFSWKVLYADQIYLSTNKADILKSSGSKSIKISNLRDKEKVEITLIAKNMNTAKEVRSNIWINSKLYADIKEKIKKDEKTFHEQVNSSAKSNEEQSTNKTNQGRLRPIFSSVKRIFITILIVFIASVISMSVRNILKPNNKRQETKANQSVELVKENDIIQNIKKSSIGSGIPDNIIVTIPKGKTANGFNFSNSGELSYKGNHFVPAVTVTDITEFEISMFQQKKWAGAIGIDIDGQNPLFFLDLEKMAALKTNASAAIKIYWSPSQLYMVALCMFEGERFISFNTQSKKEIESNNTLKPGNNYETVWRIDGKLKWLYNKDVLTFNVTEHCNYYEVDCGKIGDEVIARYKVNLDAATLKISIEE